MTRTYRYKPLSVKGAKIAICYGSGSEPLLRIEASPELLMQIERTHHLEPHEQTALYRPAGS